MPVAGEVKKTAGCYSHAPVFFWNSPVYGMVLILNFSTSVACTPKWSIFTHLIKASQSLVY
jgi:hypothetical protein